MEEIEQPNNRPQPLSRQAVPKVGFVLSSEQFPAPKQIEFGVAAERAGFAAVWTSDHFQPWQDNEGHAGFAWAMLAALGQRMSSIPMGTGVTCPSFRYRPAIVAQAFATLGLLYPGRVFLGAGTGEALNEECATGEWGDYDERAERFLEAITVIRKLWSGEIVNFKGKYYQVENAKLYDLPPQPVPIYFAAAGKESMRHAGQYGDGLISDPKTLGERELMDAFEEGARAAGKDPSSMPVIIEHWVVVGNQQDAEKWAPLWQFNPKAWDEYVDIPDPREIQHRAEKEVPLQELYGSWPVSEDPQVHIDAIRKLFDQGASTVMVHSPQEDQQRVIDFYGRHVLPALQGRPAWTYPQQPSAQT